MRTTPDKAGIGTDNEVIAKVAESTGSTVDSIERPIGSRVLIATMGSPGTSKPWFLALVDSGVGKSGVLKAIASMVEIDTKRTVVAADKSDCFYQLGTHPLMKTMLPHPEILRSVFGRFRGLLVDGTLMVGGRPPKPWEVDWDHPRLNPIVAAISDGRIPPPEKADPVESFSTLIASAPKAKTRMKRFLRACSKARPFFHEKRLW